MHRFVLSAVLVLPFLSSVVEARTELPPPLGEIALPSATSMTKAYFQASYSHLSPTDFDAKWKASLESPLLFFRSYVNSWYNELRHVPNPGVVGPCLGDPHPENFGYLWYGDEDFRYLYNDLDDVGACPIAFDALRYVTALRLTAHDETLVETVLGHYKESLGGKTLGDGRFVDSQKPRLAKLREKMAKKSFDVDTDKLKLGGEVVPVTAGEALRLRMAFQTVYPNMFEALDVARVRVEDGGSGGLSRFLILAKDGQGQREVIEFKELTKPATAYGACSPEVSYTREDYFDFAWKGETPRYFAFTWLENTPFLVRSRIKSDLDVDELSREEQLAVYLYQASLLAEIHRLSVSSPSAFVGWLRTASTIMEERYETAYRLARGE